MEARNGIGGAGNEAQSHSDFGDRGERYGNDAAVDGASIGTVLMVLQDTKKEIIREVKERADALQKDLVQRIDAVGSNVVENVLSGVSTQTLMRSGASRSRSSEDRKRKIPPSPDKLPFLDVLLQKERTPFVVQWIILCTLYSFARAYESTSSWIPRAAIDLLSPHSGVFENASGLSVLFFAVEPGQKWTRYHGKVGKMWSFVLRSSICSTILHARASDFDTTRTPEEKKKGRVVPAWLSSFGGKKETAGVVGEIVECLETTEEMMRRRGDAEMARRWKRMRAQNEPPADTFEGERDFAVSKMRSRMLQTWTYGRSEARKMLFASVMFLVEKIRSYRSVADATGDGYEIIFQEPASDEEKYVPRNTAGTIWDIPLSFVREGTEDELRDKNNDLLTELADNFPSLRLTLRYKRAVVCVDQTIDIGSVPAFWTAVEHVSLHQLALTVLTASLSGKSVKSVLQSSNLSLRAVHVIAIGLRGLIRQSLGLELTSLEKSASGGVTFDPIPKDDGDRVSTLSASRTGSRQGRGTVTSSQNITNEKFNISLAAFRAEEQKERAALREQARSTQSEAGQVHLDDESDTDLRETWLHGIV